MMYEATRRAQQVVEELARSGLIPSINVGNRYDVAVHIVAAAIQSALEHQFQCDLEAVQMAKVTDKDYFLLDGFKARDAIVQQLRAFGVVL